MDHSMMRERLKMILLIAAGAIVVLGIVAMIINASGQYANTASAIFNGLTSTAAYASIPAGLYALLVGQDMLMRHQGVPMPQPQPRPQYQAPQQQFTGQPQQFAGQPQQYQAQQPQQFAGQPQQYQAQQPQQFGGQSQGPNNYQ